MTLEVMPNGATCDRSQLSSIFTLSRFVLIFWSRWPLVSHLTSTQVAFQEELIEETQK